MKEGQINITQEMYYVSPHNMITTRFPYFLMRWKSIWKKYVWRKGRYIRNNMFSRYLQYFLIYLPKTLSIPYMHCMSSPCIKMHPFVPWKTLCKTQLNSELICPKEPLSGSDTTDSCIIISDFQALIAACIAS